MDPLLVEYLICPCCKQGSFELSVEETFYPDGDPANRAQVAWGTLVCSQCGQTFPIIEGIPRLLTSEMLSEYDGTASVFASTDKLPWAQPLSADKSKEVMRMLFIEGDPNVDGSRSVDPGSEEWVARLTEYWIDGCERSAQKYVRVLGDSGIERCNSILDIGGGGGGTAHVLGQALRAEIVVVLDLELRYLRMAKTRSPVIQAVQSNATCLPFKSKAFSLVVSFGLMEHVPWRPFLQELARVTGKTAYLVYGPNRMFPYDGHLHAPLVTWMPRPVALKFAYLWNQLLGIGWYSRDTLARISDTLHYVARYQVERTLTEVNLQHANVFEKFIEATITSDYHLDPTTDFMLRLVDNKGIRKMVITALMVLGCEPLCHFLCWPTESQNAHHG